MNELQIFNHETFGQVRVVFIDGEPWLVLKDVCDALGVGNTSDVAKRLDDDELTSIRSMSGGQNREMYIISESGLYNVILRSDKPNAKEFRRWVTHDVLPEIRKTGTYSVKPADLHTHLNFAWFKQNSLPRRALSAKYAA
jgi:prophage antirepressor-like protein